jgi:hypothetical protein
MSTRRGHLIQPRRGESIASYVGRLGKIHHKTPAEAPSCGFLSTGQAVHPQAIDQLGTGLWTAAGRSLKLFLECAGFEPVKSKRDSR